MKLALRCSLFLLLCAALAAGAADRRPITPPDLWAFARLGGPKVSPDGKLAVFPVTKFSVPEDKGTTNLWLLDLTTGATRQLTQAKASDGSPVWSPDGRSIAFTRRQGAEPAALFLLPLDGGEPRKLLELPLGVDSPRWLPNGRQLAVVTRVIPALAGDDKAMRAEVKRRAASKMTGKVTEDRTYRFWDQWATDGYAHRIYRVEADTGACTDLTPKSATLFGFGMEPPRFEVSPDGKQLAVAINVTPPPYREDLNYDLFLVPTDGSGELRNLTAASRGTETGPRFSPDGKTLLYTHVKDPSWSGENRKLFALDLATGSSKRLAADLDLSFDDYAYSADGTAIFFVAEDRGVVPVFRMNADGTGAAALQRAGTNSALEVAAGRVLVLNDTASRPAEIFSYAGQPGEAPVQLSRFNEALLAQLDLGAVESHTFTGAAGDTIQMWVTFPPGFDRATPARKWPLVQLLHGGPQTMNRDSFSYRWNSHVFAAGGYVTAWVNRHGSTGFGEKFAQSIAGEWGIKPAEDVLRATDYLVAEYPSIDPERVAAAGASYGGYLATWLLGHTDRFKCYVIHAAVTDFVGQFAGDVTYSWTRVLGGTPWENRDAMLANSPLHHAANFKAPALVVVGELDYRVPVDQGLALYGILQAKGVESRLLYYPNENHWVMKPQNSIQWNVEVRNWLVRHLGGNALELPSFAAPEADAK